MCELPIPAPLPYTSQAETAETAETSSYTGNMRIGHDAIGAHIAAYHVHCVMASQDTKQHPSMLYNMAGL